MNCVSGKSDTGRYSTVTCTCIFCAKISDMFTFSNVTHVDTNEDVPLISVSSIIQLWYNLCCNVAIQ